MPNIDRDDENATRYEMPKPSIDEQIARQKHVIDLHEAGLLEPTPSAQQAYDTDKAILATLEAHKRITESAGRPEPVSNIIKAVHEQGCSSGCGSMKHCICGYAEDLADHIEKLEAYADRVAAERDDALKAVDDNWVTHQRVVTAERQLAELQEKTQRMVEPQNPCNCVPDGDDGTVAHLCHWHKTTLGKAYRMQNMANSLTVENIAKLPQDRLRLWIAHGIQESTARKRAEEQLAECQKECEEQARLNGMGSEREARLMAQLAELQRKHDGLVKDAERLVDIGERANDLFTALLEFHNAFCNRNETTSLHIWNERMKEADNAAVLVLNREPKPSEQEN